MNGTAMPFNGGLSLIGWTVGTGVENGTATDCMNPIASTSNVQLENCISAVNGTGILTVVGIIGVASLVLEFVQFRL